MYIFTLPNVASIQDAYWAAEIPLIPDFISRRTERRKLSADDALHAALSAQAAWLARLHDDAIANTISLRYISYFAEGEWRVRLGFVGKVSAERDPFAAAMSHWSCFRATFPDSDYPLQPALTCGEFTRIFLPFYPQALAEIRRQEEIGALVESYLPVPFSARSISDMQSLCYALLASEAQQMVSITLRPTALTGDEQAQLMSEIKRFGELKQKSVQTGAQEVSYTTTVQKLHAEAELAEKYYRQLSNTLRQAWEMNITVAAPQQLSDGVLRAVVADATSQEQTEAESQILAPRAVATKPQNPGEQWAAFKNLFELRLDYWGGNLAPGGLARLPKLFPLPQVHTLFRLPLPDENGVYGMRCSAFSDAVDAGRRKGLRSAPTQAVKADEISFGSVNFARNVLTQHVLVAGIPGTGKTNTCLYLLERLWNGNPEKRVPFLVLEPAKFEYRGLLGTPGVCDELLIFTAGDESVAPLRFNPFAVPQGINLESHVGRLIDIFRASMAMWGPLPAILEKLVRRLYRRKGWRYVGAHGDCEPPHMLELYESIGTGIRELGYGRETESEATAALEVRIGRLCEGSFGKMLNTAASVDFDDLMTRPVVIEVAGVGNTDDRAFIMALLLNRLYQYWIVRKDQTGPELKHITLVEEAHNLLSNVMTGQAEGQANPKGEAVQQFANMLAEIRSFGEGLIIADQSPSKLIPDVVKMTGTKLAHAVVADEDRQALKSSMNLTDEQAYQLALLPRGEAALFQGSSGHCTQVRMPAFKDFATGFAVNVSDATVREFTASYRNARTEIYLPTPGCANCPEQCRYDEVVDASLKRLGAGTAARLELEIRLWWIKAAVGEASPAPLAGFQRALSRGATHPLSAQERQGQAFCAIAKLSHNYLKQLAADQFMKPEAVNSLHKQLTGTLVASDQTTEMSALHAMIYGAARPASGVLPFEGCEHCASPCQWRSEALRALSSHEARGVKLAPAVLTQAGQIADQAWLTVRDSDLSGSLEWQQQSQLAYCVAVQLCENSRAPVDHAEVHRQVSAGALRFAGCAHCPSRCLYGDEMLTIARNAPPQASAELSELWSNRFNKERAQIVGELLRHFSSYAAQSKSYAKASEQEQRVLTFCAALHLRDLSPVLANAGEKAVDPQGWWGDTMAEGLSLNRDE